MTCNGYITNAEYLCSYNHRVLSRTVVVHFDGPTVRPQTSEEDDSYVQLEDNLHQANFSSSIGWAIACGKKVRKQRILCIKQILREEATISNRDCQNLAILLAFVEQV